ncbi:MAG: hypothetical protein WC140_06760 [Bacteroidales bacterium]
MATKKQNKLPYEDSLDSIKEYVDLKIDEKKLILTKNLAILFNKIIYFFIIILVIGLAIGFLSSFLSQWINSLLNSNDLGTLIVGGFFILIGIIVFLFRKKLFTNSMVKMFINMFFNNKEDE